jgi:hypothetical protein
MPTPAAKRSTAVRLAHTRSDSRSELSTVAKLVRVDTVAADPGDQFQEFCNKLAMLNQVVGSAVAPGRRRCTEEMMMSSVENLLSAATNLQAADLAWIPTFLSELKGNPDKFKKFCSAPEEYIRASGYDLPEGFHVHYIDENGEYFPRETDRSPAASGSRLEARVDHDGVALGVCIYCPGGCKGKGVI